MSGDHWNKPLPDLIREIGLNSKQVELVLVTRVFQALGENIEQLRTSMEANAKSNDELSKKVHRLNIILTWATVLGSLAAIGSVLVSIFQH